MNTDRIEKKILLRASRERVWRAISDSAEFGTWFGIRFQSQFEPGKRMEGVLVPTQVIPEVGESQKNYEGMKFEFTVERIEPQRLFSFRWHPNAVDDGTDYSQESTTLVEFILEDSPGGIELTIVESGFDAIPLARRAQAFRSNDCGWSEMIRVIEAYVSQNARHA